MMTLDHEKTKEELIAENGRLRERAAAADRLEACLAEKTRAHAALELRCTSQMEALRHKAEERDRAEEAFRLARVIIDQSPVVLFRRKAEGDRRLTYVSDNIARFGYTAEAFLNGAVTLMDMVHPDDIARVAGEIEAHARADEESYIQHYRILTAEGGVRWVEDRTSVVRNQRGEKTHYQGVVVDVTECRLTEEHLRKSEERFRRIVETAGEGFLMTDEQLNIVDVNNAFCRMLGYGREELIGMKPLDLATEAFRRGMAGRCDEVQAMEYRKFEGAFTTREGREVPVLIHGNTLRDSKGEKLGNASFVADLTEQKRALALAGKVQRNLIPRRAPGIEGLDIAGRSISCDEVGGDYFDFLSGPGYGSDTLKVVVGDISGHGVDAALLMASARAFVRARAAQHDTPSGIVTAMNRDLACDMEETGHFMTLLLMEIDPRKGTAQWVRAGHDPALIYNLSEDRFEELKGAGLPLGVDGGFDYEENLFSDLSPGTIIALGTDGVWEAEDCSGRPFGKERMRRVIRENAGTAADTIVKRVFDELELHTKGRSPGDDVTLVVIKVEARPQAGDGGRLKDRCRRPAGGNAASP